MLGFVMFPLFQIGGIFPSGQVDFVKLILEQILRVDPGLIGQYPLVQDKLLWLVLVPHIVVFLFLFSFAAWLSPKHTGLRRVLAIGGYLALVLAGWYGSFIVPLVKAWFIILLVAGFLFFLVSKIFPPTTVKAATGILGEAVGLATKGSKERRQLEIDINTLRRTIASLERKAADTVEAGGDDAHIRAKISDLEERLHQKEAQLRGVGG